MSQLIDIMSQERPRMDVDSSKKGDKYHAQMVRADIGAMNSTQIIRMHQKAWLLERAYNDDVMTQEDYDTFMLDDSMNPRNRTMFGFNMVKPIIEQFRGTAIQNSFNASVMPVTHLTKTRRMMELGQLKLMHSLGEMSKEAKVIIGSHYNLGQTMAESEGIFDSKWQDANTKAMNHLLSQMASINDMNRFDGDDMMRFAIWGMLPEIARENGSHFRWERIHPKDFFYDTSFTYPDMSDATFKGVRPEMSMPKVAEMWNLSHDDMRAVEESVQQYTTNPKFSLATRNKVRVTSNYWTDVMYQEFGYARINDVPTLVRVGDTEEGITKGPITYNDLMDPPDTEENDRLFDGKKTRKSFVEVTRFADVVLWEDAAGRPIKHEDAHKREAGNMPDLILKSGPYGLQEYNPFDPTTSVNPVKVSVFASAAGEIVSPCQAILDPNRFMNRILSAIESQANSSGGKSLIIDMDLVKEGFTELDVTAAAKRGDAIPLNAGGRGVSNAVSSHDNSMGSGAYAMLQIVNASQDLIRTVTGVNASFAGEQQKDQLVGVTDILVQRGALMMEPVHDKFADLKLQKYKCMATAGKEFYLRRPDVLMDLIGDEEMMYLFQSRYFELERFNAVIVRDNPEQQKREVTNNWLNILLQQGLIDRTRYANLYNRSYVDDVAPAIREYAAELAQAENQAKRDEAKQAMQAGLAAQYAKAEEDEKEVYKDKVNMDMMLAKEGAKEKANVTREEVKGDIAAQAAKAENSQPVSM